jgi:prepilin peptidase CpaA
MILQLLFVAVLPAILIAAAVWDLTSFTIPNVFPAALLVLFLLFAGLSAFGPHGLSLADIGWHAAAGGIGLVVGMAFFAFGWIGGGDAKLFAAASLWLGWGALLNYAIFASLFGGVLTIGVLLLRNVPLPSGLLGQAWLLRLADTRSGIPYGVALSAAALALLPASDLFRLAALS